MTDAPSSADHMLRAITGDGLYRLIAVRLDASAREAAERHGTGPIGSLALARGLVAATLLSSSEKEFHRVGIQWVGRGALRSVHVDVRGDGSVRAYVGEPTAPGEADGLADALGDGLVSVIEQDIRARFTRGSRPLATGEVDTDIEDWLWHSEQVPSRLRALVTLDDDGLPSSVSGLLVQTLPGGAAEALLEGGGAIASAFLARQLPPELPLAELMASALNDDAPIDVLGESPLQFSCGCSLDRVERGVRMLGAEELLDMIEKKEPAEVRCEFCGTRYEVGLDRLGEIVTHLDSD